MSEKKVVRRTVVIALGIICIILVVGVVGAFAYYVPIINDKNNTIANKDLQITDRDDTILSLNSQIASKDSQISNLQTQITNLQSQIATKDSQISNLQSIADLQKQEVVVYQYSVNQGAGQLSAVAARSYPYSGYLRISSTSTTSNAYVNLQYWFGGKLYSSSQTVGTSGEALFAILKTDSATVYVGNTNWLNGATETVTITYYY
jgi:septal ring factor EnvC (AmiA/AmiB activator)